MAVATEPRDLTRQEYEKIRRLVYAKSGINLGDQKMQLVRARLSRKVRAGGFKSFGEYLHHVEQDQAGERLGDLLDAISTNTTHLFREIQHFKLLSRIIDEWPRQQEAGTASRPLSIWSAASSSGEEPYSIAMVAHDVLRRHPNIQLRILATDISNQMLDKARAGVFESDRLGPTPPQYKQRYLRSVQQDGHRRYQAVPEIRRLISFARFNLMTPTYPFRHGFDIIFCRNVMIYFDRPTQESVVKKLAGQLHQGGHLMIGHSESLNNIQHPLEYVQPTVYRKKKS